MQLIRNILLCAVTTTMFGVAMGVLGAAEASAIKISTGNAPANAESLDPLDDGHFDATVLGNGAFKGSFYDDEVGNLGWTPGDVPNMIGIFGTTALHLSTDAHYIGFLVDAIDPTDVIQFDKGNTLIESFTGAELETVLNSQGASSFFANFTSADPFDKIVFSGKIFVIDNVKAATSILPIATVPLPAALPLFGSVVGGIGVFGRIRRKAAKTA